MCKKYLEESLRNLKKIGDFCLEKKDSDTCKALYHVCPIFDSTFTLLSLLYDSFDTLEFNMQGEGDKIDTCQQVGNLIVDQSRFTFISTISSLEFTAKNISLKDESPIKNFLRSGKETKNQKDYYLKNIIYASNKLKIIADEEKQEWDFFIDIRNALVHKNGIPDKDLSCEIYGKLYSFEKEKEMGGDIQSFFIFSKRAVELFYDWSQEHQNTSFKYL